MAIAIGDIHGCLHALEQLVDQLPGGDELVFLGDYVDRGPDSADVIRYVSELAEKRPCRLLIGNHEIMMAAAIEQQSSIDVWLTNGGEATVKSYGRQPEQWRALADGDRQLPSFAEFFDSLLPYYEDQHAIYVHAGLDTKITHMELQDPSVLVWIREAFFKHAEQWRGKPVVFGHTPTMYMGLPHGAVFRSHSITGIDTGCVYGGHLTGLCTVTGRVFQTPGMPLRYGLAD